MGLGRVGAGVGKGLIAGLAGTAAMTVSSTLEARLRDRGASSAPTDAAKRVLGIEQFRSDAEEQRFGQLVHWGYGTGWGAVRGVLRAAGVGPAGATLLHLAAVWGGEQVMLPKLGVTPPATEWGGEEVAIDLWHHVVYAVGVAVAYELLEAGDR
ncbi:MAG TPA: hypothetical protein VK875_06400 [Euzebyales bacterium]|nr:hypothetical protein [Euzebyales bacterium]